MGPFFFCTEAQMSDLIRSGFNPDLLMTYKPEGAMKGITQDRFDQALLVTETIFGGFVGFREVSNFDFVRYVDGRLPWDAYYEVIWSQARGRYEARVVLGEEIGFGRSRKCMDAAILQALWDAAQIIKGPEYALDPFFSESVLAVKYRLRKEERSSGAGEEDSGGV